MRRDRDERGKKIAVRFPDTLQFVPQLAERLSLTVPCDGTRWYWTSLVDSPVLLQRCPVPSHGTVSPPFWTVPRSLLLPRHGGRQQVPASQRTAPTPPLPLGRQPPLLDPGARQRALCPTCPSIAPAPPPRAATCGLRFFLLLDLLSTTIPLSSEGSLTACPSFLPSFGTNVTQFIDREEGGGNRRTFKHFNNKINKHKIKAAAPHGRLPHIKHK